MFPAVVPLALFDLARESAKPSALRDEALRALARFDAGQGIPALTDALSDSRARIAIYALRSAILEMPADRAIALLQTVPTDKVTVAKEVIRLLGEVDSPAAYPLLLEMDSRPLHRDVHVALLRALWEHLETPETWPILESAAADSDPAVAGGVIRIPTDRLSPTAQQRLLNLQRMLLSHPDPDVRLATLRRCADLPLPDPTRLLLSPLLTCLSSTLPDETDVAARAVFTTYIGGPQQDSFAIGAAIVQIKNNRRILRTTLDALRTALHQNRRRLRATVRAVLDALADDPVTAEARAVLAVVGLPWDAVVEYLSRLAQTNELHASALISTARTIEQSRHGDGIAEAETGLQSLESAFAAQGDERLRYLAVAALIARSNTNAGWTHALRMRLETYRADPSPLVAAAAQFHFPPPEEQPDSLADLEESTEEVL